MTKKDFKKFAELIVEMEKWSEGLSKKDLLERLENRICEILKDDNWRFDFEKWEKYKEKVKSKI